MKRTIIYGVVAVLLIAAVAVVLYLNSGKPGGASISLDGQIVSPTFLITLQRTANNMSLANKVGAGSSTNLAVSPNSTVPLIINGKPAVVYIGANYCPFCAITRWGLIIALMRFGNFSNLEYMTSSSTDVYANTPTFTFSNSSYSSQYVTFDKYEEDAGGNLTQIERTIIKNQQFNNPNVIGESKQSIPLVDFGNFSIQVGADASPGDIQLYNWSYIVNQLPNPNSSITQAVMGNANIFTAQICKMTNNVPTNVCGQKFISRVGVHS